MELHVYHHLRDDTGLLKKLCEADDYTAQALPRIEAAIASLTKGISTMNQNLENLKAAVTRNTDVDASAVTLLQGLAAQIEALKTDPVALQALADSLNADTDTLAAAVSANTPAAPTA